MQPQPVAHRVPMMQMAHHVKQYGPQAGFIGPAMNVMAPIPPMAQNMRGFMAAGMSAIPGMCATAMIGHSQLQNGQMQNVLKRGAKVASQYMTNRMPNGQLAAYGANSNKRHKIEGLAHGQYFQRPGGLGFAASNAVLQGSALLATPTLEGIAAVQESPTSGISLLSQAAANDAQLLSGQHTWNTKENIGAGSALTSTTVSALAASWPEMSSALVKVRPCEQHSARARLCCVDVVVFLRHTCLPAWSGFVALILALCTTCARRRRSGNPAMRWWRKLRRTCADGSPLPWTRSRGILEGTVI